MFIWILPNNYPNTAEVLKELQHDAGDLRVIDGSFEDEAGRRLTTQELMDKADWEQKSRKDQVHEAAANQGDAIERMSMTAMARLGITDPYLIGSVTKSVKGESEEGPPTQDKDFSSKSGYIDRRGRFYGCEYMHHQYLAPRIIKHVLKREEEFRGKDPQAMLDELGFVRIASSLMSSSDIVILFDSDGQRRRATKAQVKTVVDFCLKHEVDIPYWIKE